MNSFLLIDYYSTSLHSPIHQCSAKGKLFFLLAFFGAILASANLWFLIVLFFFLLALIFISELPVFRILSWSLYLVFFASLFAASQIGYGLLPVFTVLRALDASLVLLLVISTTPYVEIFSLLSKISPFLATFFFLTYRYFFLFLHDVERKVNMLRIRGGYFRGWFWRMKNIASLFGQMILFSLEKSERFFEILKVRGFGGSISSRFQSKFSRKDAALAALGILFFTTSLYFLWKGMK